MGPDIGQKQQERASHLPYSDAGQTRDPERAISVWSKIKPRSKPLLIHLRLMDANDPRSDSNTHIRTMAESMNYNMEIEETFQKGQTVFDPGKIIGQ